MKTYRLWVVTKGVAHPTCDTYRTEAYAAQNCRLKNQQLKHSPAARVSGAVYEVREEITGQ